FNTLSVAVDPAKIDALGGEVDFDGTATGEVLATSDHHTYESNTIDARLTFRKQLTPTPDTLVQGVIFVNDSIEVDGDGFLLGGDEGTTYAKVHGCFKLDAGGGCTAVADQEIAMAPREDLSREKAAFPF